jgi:hypothetical protein
MIVASAHYYSYVGNENHVHCTHATQFILHTGSSLNKHKSESTKSYYYFLSAACDKLLELLALIMTFEYDTICQSGFTTLSPTLLLEQPAVVHLLERG